MNRIITFLLVTASTFCTAQNPNIVKWEKNYYDLSFLTSMQKINENAYLISGYQANRKGDFYVMKIDSIGNKIWGKQYGGMEQDILMSIQVDDDGYYLAGYTQSYEGNINYNHGRNDMWLLKIDFEGNIVWEKTYGGKNDEELTSCQRLKNGNLMICGFTMSNDGDIQSGISGDRNAWVIEVDKSGNIIWEKTYGNYWASFSSFQETIDGNYVFAGQSRSYNYGEQFWIVKTDKIGKIIWEKNYGGTNEERINLIHQTKDGEYIVVGETHSSDGDIKSINHGLSDIWVIKLDHSGNLVWEKTYGGKKEEFVYSSLIDKNDNFLLSGLTYSYDGDVQSNYTTEKDDWLLNISNNGELLWEQTYHTEGNTFEKGFIEHSYTGSYLLGSGHIIRLIGSNTSPKNIFLSNNQSSENYNYPNNIGQFTVYEDFNEEHTFKLVDGDGDTDNRHFGINGISLMADTVFDFEKQSKYTIRVEATDTEGNSFSKPFEIFIKNINDIALQNVIVKNTTCTGYSDGSINYDLTNVVQPVSFKWSNSDTTQNLNNVGSGIYTVKIIDADSMTFEQTFRIDTKLIYPATQICYITSNGFSNVIYIDKGSDNYNIARYCIYREGIYANIYDKIGEISASENSFVDSLINNRSQSYTYKVSAIDSCGVESALSPAHSTIHLTQNRGISGEVNLYWANYLGIDVSTYSIFRQKENETFELIKQISSNKNTFSDFDINPSFNYQYYVSFEKEDVCYTTLNQKSGEKIIVKSNIVSTNKDYTRSEITQSPAIKIYPNPVSGKFYVETGTDKPTNLILLDINGRQIIQQRLNENKNEINLPKIVDGIYFVKLMLDNQIIHYQIIIKAGE